MRIYRDPVFGTPGINPKRAITGLAVASPPRASIPEVEEHIEGLAPAGLRVGLLQGMARPPETGLAEGLLQEGARHQHLSGLGVGLLQERARHQGRRTTTVVTRNLTLMGFSVIDVGFMGISDEIVEGDVRGVPVQEGTTQTG